MMDSSFTNNTSAQPQELPRQFRILAIPSAIFHKSEQMTPAIIKAITDGAQITLKTVIHNCEFPDSIK